MSITLFGKSVGKITISDLERLRDNQIPESMGLEYKRETPANSVGDKKEFLADISSMANTLGGIIIYGVEEAKDEGNQNTGCIGELCGMRCSNPDGEKLRLEQIIRDGLQPRLSHFEIVQLVQGDRSFLILKIPRSANAPHVVWLERWSKFYKRNSSGKYQMDVSEIRASFLEKADWVAKAEETRERRVQYVLKARYHNSLEDPCILLLHIIPLGTDSLLSPGDLPQIEVPQGFDCKYSLAGVTHSRKQAGGGEYFLYFRSGGLEYYTTNVVNPTNRSVIFGDSIENHLRIILAGYLDAIKRFDLSGPVTVMLTLLNVNQKILAHSRIEPQERRKFNLSELQLPSIVIEDLETSGADGFDQLFQVMWQSAGFESRPRILKT